jgi:predicted nucleotidyltransferase
MAIAANIEDKIRRFLELANKDIRVEAVYLFGSTAKGKTHAWSDIDLAIVSPDFSGDSFEDNKKLFPYILKVDTAIEVHAFRPEDFVAANPFIKEIVSRGIRFL